MTTPGPKPPTLENRLPQEGISSSDEHPLKEFAWLVAGGLVTLVLAVVLIDWGARWLAPHVPFRYEVALANAFNPGPSTAEAAPREAALQALADRLAPHMNLPEGMHVTLHYSDSPMVNAFATVGGHITVMRGILQTLPNENALAALLAHEMAHVKHRHVAANAGRGLALGLLLSVLSSDAGATVAQGVLGQAAGVAMAGYSREQETQSDEAALHALAAMYGHAGGFVALFNTLAQAEREGARDDPANPSVEPKPQSTPTAPWWRRATSLEMLRSHPLTRTRIDHAQALAQTKGILMQGAVTPLAPALRLPAKGDKSAGA